MTSTEAVGSYHCCGVRIDAFQPGEAVDILLRSRHGVGRSVHLCNAFTLSLAVRDSEFRTLLNSGDLNLADGTPVARYGRRRGFPNMLTRVYGPALFEETLRRSQGSGLRHFLYGSTPPVLEALREEIARRYPAATIVGSESPPFRPLTAEESAALARRISTSGADIVWVGLGTPKQDTFAESHKGALSSTIVAVGAAFDFLAGTKRQAPGWIQEHGIEWAYRLLTEPRRLWRRYLIGNTVFLWGALRSGRLSRD